MISICEFISRNDGNKSRSAIALGISRKQLYEYIKKSALVDDDGNIWLKKVDKN